MESGYDKRYYHCPNDTRENGLDAGYALQIVQLGEKVVLKLLADASPVPTAAPVSAKARRSKIRH